MDYYKTIVTNLILGIIFILALSLTYSSCKTMTKPKETISANSDTLKGVYTIQKLKTDDFEDSFQNKEYTISFNANNISAYIGCNRMGGQINYTENNKIEIGPLFSTKMYCEHANLQETELGEALSKANGFELKGNTLKIFGGQCEIDLLKQ